MGRYGSGLPNGFSLTGSLCPLGCGFCQHAGGFAEATAQDFLMAGDIVGAFDGLDFEAAVFAILGASTLEDNHGADRVGALRVGDIVALDALRRGDQIEGLL